MAKIKRYFSRPRKSMFIVGAIVCMALCIAFPWDIWFGLASAACAFACLVIDDEEKE